MRARTARNQTAATCAAAKGGSERWALFAFLRLRFFLHTATVVNGIYYDGDDDDDDEVEP